MNEKISIIVPIYNAAPYLDRCIETLIKQTYQNKEIILVNDGSKDNSLSICELWKTKSPLITVISQKNQGVTIARKNGVWASTGSIVAFVDSDDELPLNAIELLYDAMGSSDIVIGQVEFHGKWDWPYSPKNFVVDRKKYLKMMFRSKCVHGGPFARLFRRSLFDENVFDIPRSINCGEDFLMNLRLAFKAKTVQFIPELVYLYLSREGSVMNSGTSTVSTMKVMREYETHLRNCFGESMSWFEKKLFFKALLGRRIRFLKSKVKKISKKIHLT